MQSLMINFIRAVGPSAGSHGHTQGSESPPLQDITSDFGQNRVLRSCQVQERRGIVDAYSFRPISNAPIEKGHRGEKALPKIGTRIREKPNIRYAIIGGIVVTERISQDRDQRHAI